MNFFDKECSEFNSKKVRSILANVEKRIKENVAKIHSLIENDNKTHLEKFEFSKLLSTIDRANNEEWIMEKSDKNKFYSGIGNIGVCYNKTPDVPLYLIMKALKNNNNIVFFEEDNVHEATRYIVDLFNEECTKNGYNVSIKITSYCKVDDLVGDADSFNMFIFIGEPQSYLEFSARNNSNVKTICSGYGSMDLFLDDKNLKDTLLEIDEYVYNNNIELELYKNEKVQDVVKKINTGKHNYCAVIFTQSKEDAYYFIKNVRAEKIFVNKNPMKSYEFEIDDKELVSLKKIYI